jgi:type I restriction enzyme, S subunit
VTSDCFGKLPTGWAKLSLGQTLDVIRGVTFPTDAKRGDLAEGYIACLRTANVQREVKWGDLWFVPIQYVKREEQHLRPGDILISMANSLELVGKVSFVGDLPRPATLGAFISAIRTPSGLNPRFVYFQLASREVQSAIRRFASTTTNISNVSTGRLVELGLRFAPAAEQDRIVAEIEKHFTRLDAAVAALERTRAKLKRYRAAVLKAACEGRLVPTEAELARAEGREYEPADLLLARILRERRARWEANQLTKQRAKGQGPKDDRWKAKYEKPIEPDKGSLPELPEGWVWATWEQIGFSQNGRAFPSSDYQDTGVRLLRPGNLHISGKVIWTDSNTRCLPEHWARDFPDYLVGPRELVMNLTAQSLRDEFLGRVCMTGEGEPCLLNQRIARLTPVLASPEYLLWMFKSVVFRRFVDGLNTGSLIQHMFTSQLAGFTLPFPPLQEQQRIVAEVERRLSVVDELETQIEVNLKRAERLRQAILKRAFEGKLVPQNPNDEPASALLDRIRAEQGSTARNGSSRGRGRKPARGEAAATLRLFD